MNLEYTYFPNALFANPYTYRVFKPGKIIHYKICKIKF